MHGEASWPRLLILTLPLLLRLRKHPILLRCRHVFEHLLDDVDDRCGLLIAGLESQPNPERVPRPDSDQPLIYLCEEFVILDESIEIAAPILQRPLVTSVLREPRLPNAHDTLLGLGLRDRQLDGAQHLLGWLEPYGLLACHGLHRFPFRRPHLECVSILMEQWVHHFRNVIPNSRAFVELKCLAANVQRRAIACPNRQTTGIELHDGRLLWRTAAQELYQPEDAASTENQL